MIIIYINRFLDFKRILEDKYIKEYDKYVGTVILIID